MLDQWRRHLSRVDIDVGEEVYLHQFPSFDSTIYVDDDNTEGPWDGTSEHPYQTIQDGIDNASDFDTVFVRNGTYVENVDIPRPLTLLGESRKSTIIDGGGSGHVVRVSRPEGNGSIQQFTIQHSGSYENPFGPSDSGIALYSADPVYNQFLFENILRNNFVGISIYTASNNFIASNRLETNEIGLHITPSFGYSQYNTIIENTFVDNTVGVQSETPDRNSIFHNNFIRNSWHASDEYANNWDDEVGMGNYWDDYTGSDAEGDGVGEQVYEISGAGDNNDRYPLLYPLEQEEHLVGLYHMDEGKERWVYDSSWNYNHGTCFAPVWMEGISDDALLFNGTTDYGLVNDSDSLRFKDSFTIAAWVYTTRVFNESNTTHQMVVAKQYEPGNRSYSLELYQHQARFTLFDCDDTAYTITGQTRLNQSQWYHLTSVYNNVTGNLSLFIDGLLDNRTTIGTHPPQQTVLDLFIGANQTNTTDQKTQGHFQGKIDEVYLYDRLLTDDEVFQLYKKDAPLRLQGSCFYDHAQTQPVDTLSVTIENLNINTSWQAQIRNNTYHCSLRLIDDVRAGDTLRYFAKDATSTINVTDYQVTEQDIDTREVILDFILEEYYRDLVDFPMYLAEADNPNYTTEQLCGAATLQMNLNYVWWNQSIHDRPLDTYDNQTWLFETARANNSNATLPYIDAVGMHHTLETQSPFPYEEYGYHYAIKHSTNSSSILAQICEWIDYPAGKKPGHPVHVPACTPAFGNYSRWMSIRGIHTNTTAYPPKENLGIYGFWINDPYPTGIGENTYKTAEEWNQTYYSPLNVTDDPYNDKYVAIVEPPKNLSNKITLLASPPRFRTTLPSENLCRTGSERSIFRLVADRVILQAAVDGVTQQLLPYSEEARSIFQNSYPQKPWYVKNLADEKQDYYLISFTENPRGFQPRTDHREPPSNDTVFVVCISAHDGHFQEASWNRDPVLYLPLSSKHDVVPLVMRHLKSMGYHPDELPSRAIDLRLVYRQHSPYHPEWQIIIDALGLTFYLNQQGKFS